MVHRRGVGAVSRIDHMVNISIEYTGNIIICRVNGSNSEANVIRYLNDVHHAMEEHRCGKVLVVENLSGPGLGLVTMYHIIRAAKKTILSLPHAIAYIDMNPEHDHRSLKFAETVALNRFINIRLFSDTTEAAQWLESIIV
jgi:hypothetical protein